MTRYRSPSACSALSSVSSSPAVPQSARVPKKPKLAGISACLNNGAVKLALTKEADTFFHFIAERHRIFKKRLAGEPAPWTNDDILRRAHFTNVFRVYDRDSQYIIKHIIPAGDQDFREICFRVILFRLFDRVETWEYLASTLPLSWKSFNRRAYSKALDRRVRNGYRIYGGAYQMPAPTEAQIGGATSHERHLRLLECMMRLDLPGQLRGLDQLGDMCRRVLLFPSMGAFLAAQLTLDLNMIPGLQRPEDWTIPGPGAQSGLRMIFGDKVTRYYSQALSWLHDHQTVLFKRAGIMQTDIPAILPGRPGLTIVDLEHALCETHKYVTIQRRGPGGQASRTYKAEESSSVTCLLPPRWKLTALAVEERDKKYNRPSAAVTARRAEESRWFISHIVEKEMISREVHYKVRWYGYGPHDDTWEPENQLRKDAPKAVEDYERFLRDLGDTLSSFRHTA